MSELYRSYVDSEGYKLIERVLVEEVMNYKDRLAALPKDIENTKDPISFTMKSVELAAKIKTLELVLEMPEAVLKTKDETTNKK